MSGPAAWDEIESATIAFQLALAKLGAEVAIDLLGLWSRGIDAARIDATAPSWLSRAERVIQEKRAQARDLGMSYYRLTRAIATGFTVADPARPGEGRATLSQLREDFIDRLVDADVPIGTFAVPAQAAAGTEVVEVEDIGFTSDDETAIEADAAQEAVENLTANGTENLRRKVRIIDRRESAESVDARRDEARNQAGAAQAATGARIAMNAARSRLWELAKMDGRVVAYARVSTTGTPCGWCAMLISRGAVYKSAQSAEFNDGDLYHDNCRCVAVPVYSLAQARESSLFDMNREYDRLWDEVIRKPGYSGKDAVSVWRKFIRGRSAQAAPAQTPIVQEA